MNEAQFHSTTGSDTQLTVQALDGLRRATGIAGHITSPSNRTDIEVTLQIADKALTYVCEVKPKIDRFHTLSDLKARFVVGRSTLLICHSLTTSMATRCRELDIQFLDTAGNAYFTDQQGVLVNVIGRKPENAMLPSMHDATITSSALRMMFAFLADPTMLNAPYRDIAKAVNISTGTIGKVFDVLEARGFTGTTPNGTRIITAPERMLSEWATGYASRLRPKLKKFRFATPNPDRMHQWNPGYRESAWSGVWGGEVAAEKITKHLNPATFTIYLDMNEHPNALAELVKEYRLRADPHGAVEVVQPFWNMHTFADDFPTVPLHLVYADLLASNDSRNLIVAEQILGKVIDRVHNSTR